MTVIIEDKSAQFLDALEGVSRAALLQVGRQAVDRAVAIAPVKTGRYRDSIGKNVGKEEGDIVLNFGAKSPLAHIIEWGSVKHKPMHIIQKASVGMQEDFERELTERAEKIKE